MPFAFAATPACGIEIGDPIGMLRGGSHEISTLLAIGFLVSALLEPTYSQETDVRIERLEQAFINADDLEIIHEIDKIPTDVVDAFRAMARWDSMADWGELWNTGDLVLGDMPTRQHIFSAVSPKIAAVVYQIGGWGRETTILVAERGDPGFCAYRIGEALPRSMRAIQGSIRNKERSHWSGKYMHCDYHAP